MAVLEKTDYRLALEDESRADHFFALVDLSDYLSLMNMLFTSISKRRRRMLDYHLAISNTPSALVGRKRHEHQ